MCVCLHFVPILASKIPALCFCYQCKSSCWICFYCTFSPWLLMYLRSVKWHSTLAARRFAAAPETHPFPSTCTRCCWHACFRSSQTAKHSTQDDDACSGKWCVWPTFSSLEPWNSHFEQKTFSFCTKYFFVCLLVYSFLFCLFFYKFLYLYLTLGM